MNITNIVEYVWQNKVSCNCVGDCDNKFGDIYGHDWEIDYNTFVPKKKISLTYLKSEIVTKCPQRNIV